MIVGLGVDLVEIARIERAMKNPRFVTRILTPYELEYCTTPQRVAGRWAAKEAIAKAVGLKMSWQDVEILPDPFGQPTAVISPRHIDSIRMRVKVSISHEKTHAVAVAILERLVFQAPESLI